VKATFKLFDSASRLIPLAQLEPSIVELAAQAVSVIAPDTPSFHNSDRCKEEEVAFRVKPSDE
jgi:hypothetical protein